MGRRPETCERGSQTLVSGDVDTEATSKLGLLAAELTKELECPVSQLLMSHPVTLASGHVFEQRVLQECLDVRGVCPVTRQPGVEYTPAYLAANVIEILTRHFPPLQEQRYDFLHAPLPFRNVVDLCLEGKCSEAESAVRGVKFRMRTYVHGVSDRDVLVSLHAGIVSGNFRLARFLLTSMRRNVGASIDGHGILRVLCGAFHETSVRALQRSDALGRLSWQQEQDRVSAELDLLRYSFDVLAGHRRRHLQATTESAREDSAARIFAGTDAVAEGIMNDPFIYSLVRSGQRSGRHVAGTLIR
jgi:hypothetical protein